MEIEKSAELNMDDNSNHSSNSQKSKCSSRKHWTSGNFEVIEVFEDEAQLQDWFNNQGAGRDWITECKRDTRTHNVTELICRFSTKYSGRRVSNSPYNCQSRLRIRRPLNIEASDQSIIVEKTATDHDHEPKTEKDQKEDYQHSPIISSTSAEKNKRDSSEKVENKEFSPSHDLQINEEYGEFEIENLPNTSTNDNHQQIENTDSTEISNEARELIEEKTALGWDARKIQNFMMTQRMKSPTTAQICDLAKKFETKKLIELMKKKCEADEKIREFTEKVAQIGEKVSDRFGQQEDDDEVEKFVLETVDETPETLTNEAIENNEEKKKKSEEKMKIDEKKPTETNQEVSQNLENLDEIANESKDIKMDNKEAKSEEKSSIVAIQTKAHQPAALKQSENKQKEENKQQLGVRPKRARRLYSPEPHTRLSIEPKRKKEKSEENIPNLTSSSTSSLSNIPSRILWAKEPPKQLHIEKPKNTTNIKAVLIENKPKTSSQIVKSSPMYSQSASSGINIFETPNMINLMRQNEKLTKELSQLKRQNQEQSKQIEALISANKELIWAFNESRKGHDELMGQFQLLTGNREKLAKTIGQRRGLNGGSIPTMSAKAGGALQQKRISFGQTAAGSSKKRYKSKPSEVFVPTDRSMPTSLALLNKKEQQGNSEMANSRINEQLLTDVKREIKEQEHWSDEEGDVRDESNSGIIQQQKKLLREEELEKIKQQIEALPTVAGPEVSKLLGQRRPPIYMPKESGDWHMVFPGDLRRQIIFKLFHALCSEYNQDSIEEYLKAYPSRVDYIKNTMEFAFKTENDLFVDSPNRECYIQMISAKILSLLETNNRLSDAGGEKQRKQRNNNNGEGIKRRKSKILNETSQ